MELITGRSYIFRCDTGLYHGLFSGWSAGKLTFENVIKFVETTDMPKVQVNALRIVDIEEWRPMITLDASPSLRAMRETAEELSHEQRYCLDRAKAADIENW